MPIFNYIKMFFEYPLNPTKNARRFLNKQKSKNNLSLKRKIQRLSKIDLLKKEKEITTHQSVFAKFFILIFVCLISFFCGFYLINNEDKISNFVGFFNFFLNFLLKKGVPQEYVNIIFIFFFGLLTIIITGIPLLIGLYLYNPIFKFALFLHIIGGGIAGGMLISILKIISMKYLPYETFFNVILSFHFITLLITLLIISFLSFLYYSKKIKVNEKYRNLAIKLYMLSFCLGFGFILRYFKLSWWINIINLLLALINVLLGSLMWILALEGIDNFIEHKIPKKYEWLLVYLFLLSFSEIFLGVLNLLLYFYKFIKQNNKQKVE
ncbi:Bax inhibitor-1/YccA family membrane protein [Candidatus Phytoplasma meliae]|uniref:Bax inhibitor-1/YccA family protein n=1 Tax=Candidatus Phytoplasma meliae TaxID=1848402 RepID=A0ABS5CYL7_9MOLU|nr:Bax inhibitor-1/YccA family protein [Candidatus Phytoplasma meliae]MBP5836062.1 Bax inhibitor-1/YccA family protein [Candidatus Phytoplasma meliae]